MINETRLSTATSVSELELILKFAYIGYLSASDAFSYVLLVIMFGRCYSMLQFLLFKL